MLTCFFQKTINSQLFENTEKEETTKINNTLVKISTGTELVLHLVILWPTFAPGDPGKPEAPAGPTGPYNRKNNR